MLKYTKFFAFYEYLDECSMKISSDAYRGVSILGKTGVRKSHATVPLKSLQRRKLALTK